MERYSQTLASSANLFECWICHLMPASTFGKTDESLVTPVSNFSTVPNFTVDYAKLPL